MKKHFTDKLYPLALAFVLMVFSSAGFAAGGNYSSDVELDPIIELIEQGDFQAAINQLHDALDLHPDNADIIRRCADLLRVGPEG